MVQDNTKLLVITQKVDKNAPILGFFHNWMKAFAQHFNKVIVVCLEKGEHDLPENVSVYSLGKEVGESRLKYVFNFFWYVLRFAGRYDAVLVHMNEIYMILGGWVWQLFGKRVLWWKTHGDLSRMSQIGIWFADVVLTASADSFPLATDKKRVVGHGIDTDAFVPPENPKESNVLRIISVGRLSPVKHTEDIIRAVARLQKEGMSMTVKIIGPAKDKAYTDRLKELVEQKDLDEIITFTEAVAPSQMPAVYRQADILVNTSDTDSIDKVVLEAMASGTIPVTSNDAFKSILSDYGLWVPKRSPEKLAWAILRIADMEPDEKNELKDKLRNIVIENHSLDHLAQQVYEYAQQ